MKSPWRGPKVEWIDEKTGKWCVLEILREGVGPNVSVTAKHDLNVTRVTLPMTELEALMRKARAS